MDDVVAAPAKRLPIGRILFGIVAVIALGGIGRQIGPYLPEFEAWVNGLGVWGPVVFMAGYVVGTVALVPGSALTLAAGAVFGLGPASCTSLPRLPLAHPSPSSSPGTWRET